MVTRGPELATLQRWVAWPALFTSGENPALCNRVLKS